MDDNWKLPPYRHQWEIYLRTRDLRAWGLFLDQGLGKTAICLATGSHLFRVGRIRGMFVLAPNGIEVNWARDEIPEHLAVPHEVFTWSNSKRKTKTHAEGLERLFAAGDDRLRVLCMSYNGLMTDDGAKAARRFLTEFDTLYIADEATAFKTPSTKTAKRVLATAKHGTFRRLLNGTPVEDSPFHSYTQVRWLDPNVWAKIGINNAQQHKNFFGIWEKRQLANGRSFPNLVRYRNLPKMAEALRSIGDRLEKDDVLDLPPKVYSKVHFSLSPEQARIYKALKEDYQAAIVADETLTADLAIVRLTRFQQITSGYAPTDEDEELRPIAGKNPRLGALEVALDETTLPVIVWAKYTADIDAIAEVLRKRKMSFGIWDGRTSPEDRQRLKEDFQAGKLDVFLAKASSAGRGITLTAASTVIYYNNTFSLDERKQSEDRAHRIGQTKSVRYIDIVATDTVDERILEVLRGKRDISALVTGDRRLDSWV
jgi:hypothetical protein